MDSKTKALYAMLNNGESFGIFEYWNHYENKPLRYPLFHTVLVKHYCKNILCWDYYGSSANKNTLQDLEWILENIFNMTADEFIKKYMSKTEYDRMKQAINNLFDRNEKLL